MKAVSNISRKFKRLFTAAISEKHSSTSNKFRDANWKRRGVTLVELAIVLLVIGIIMTIVFSNVDFGVAKDAMKLQIRTSANTLPLTMERYNGQLSEGDSLLILTEKNPEDPSWRPLKEEAVMDPWKRPYFVRIGENESIQICSNGKDGEPGGEGESTDFCITDKNSWPAWLK